jgi:hypothetical protein
MLVYPNYAKKYASTIEKSLFRTTHFPIRTAHFEKWEALG